MQLFIKEKQEQISFKQRFCDFSRDKKRNSEDPGLSFQRITI